MSDVTS